jgi:guanylate kinase
MAENNPSGRLLIVSAPSGTGKSTIISHLMEQGLNLHFSVSATSRPPRGKEQNGVDYFFLTPEEFRRRIEAGDFLEYEEVYADRFYGTLREQVDRQLAQGENVVCDVDVNGGQRIKALYGPRALSLFIKPPSIEALRARLEHRATDSAEVIEQRLERAAYELSQAATFDAVIVNDDLATAKQEATDLVSRFLNS